MKQFFFVLSSTDQPFFLPLFFDQLQNYFAFVPTLLFPVCFSFCRLAKLVMSDVDHLLEGEELAKNESSSDEKDEGEEATEEKPDVEGSGRCELTVPCLQRGCR